MKMCDDMHDEIVWATGPCPLCEEIGHRLRVEDDLSNARDEINGLRYEVSELESKLSEEQP